MLLCSRVIFQGIFIYIMKQMTIYDMLFDDQRELWNKDFTRLTILLDPGRIKSGLEVNRIMGRVFKPKQVYRLVIDKGWKDIEGFELQSSYIKTFSVVQEDIVHPDINSWNIKFPKDRKDFCKYYLMIRCTIQVSNSI